MVGFPAGASPDFVARVLAEYVKGYAPSVIVDNRPGAGGRLPLDALKGGDPDGSVMVLTPGDQVALFPHVYAKLGYDALCRSATRVSPMRCTAHIGRFRHCRCRCFTGSAGAGSTSSPPGLSRWP